VTGAARTEAALLRLARVLEVEVADVEFLRVVGADALRAVRALVLNRLYEGEDQVLALTAAAAPYIPIALSNRIVATLVPPTIGAALVGRLDPDRAVQGAAQVPAEYLADCAQVMDPRIFGAIVPELRIGAVEPVVAVLLARGDFVTLGTLAPELTDEQVRALACGIDDEELLRLLHDVEGSFHADRLVSLLPDRLDGLLRAAHEEALWAQALELTTTFGRPNLALIADAIARQPDPALASLGAAVVEGELAEHLLRLVSAAAEPARRRLARGPAAQDDRLVATLVACAAEKAMWPALLQFVDCAEAEGVVRAAEHLVRVSDHALDALVQAAHVDELTPALLKLAGVNALRDRLIGRPGFADTKGLDGLVDMTVRRGAWDELLSLVASLTPDQKAEVVRRMGELAPGALVDAVVSADSTDRLGDLLELARDLPAAARELVIDVVTDPGSAYGQAEAILTAATPAGIWAKLSALTDGLTPDAVHRVSDRARTLGWWGTGTFPGRGPSGAPPPDEQRPRPRPGPRRRPRPY
jgi:hypothetical protein